MKRTREGLLAAVFLAPSALLLTGVVFYPILLTFYASVCEVDRKGIPQRFGTLQNFRDLIHSDVFVHDIVPQTVIWTVVVVAGTMAISMVVALALNERLPGRRLMRAIVLLPWATALVISAAIFTWLLHPTQGPINGLLRAWGLMETPPPWLATPDLAFVSVIVVGIWVSIPFTSTVLLAGLQAIPDELHEAALIDGANAWQRFRMVTLPLLRPVLLVAVVLNVIYVFNSFPIIWTLTQGGPANQTHIIVTYLYKTAIWERQYGQGYAMAMITFVVLLAFAITYTLWFGREEVERL
ncbi:MAG: sugar ABC transporter permease [Armatimonadota bacterium]|nr:sugar ABC transporter permease [Armatimonadota bacterium]